MAEFNQEQSQKMTFLKDIAQTAVDSMRAKGFSDEANYIL